MGADAKTPDMECRETIRNILILILNNILEHPKDCKVEIICGDLTTQFEVEMHQLDYGRFLGSKGKTVQALRTVVSTMSTFNGFRGIISVKNEDKFF